ncbi:hypothetical protein WCQ02_33445 [Paraburkholderia tropica]|uniref:hypothetical protein n=1 Tax=Paraburkholderia tropica TaxID=92647 RepID=UPI00301728EC
MSPPIKWLLVEALLPLFGATLIYTVLGGAKWLVTRKQKRVKWEWKEAFDSMGWLYGGAIIAVQAGLKGEDSAIYGQYTYIVWLCFAAAVICGFVLAAAMVARGEDADWRPPGIMLISTCVLMAVIVFAAFKIQSAAYTNGVENVRQTSPDASGS